MDCTNTRSDIAPIRNLATEALMMPPVLGLTTLHASHATRSGYQTLAEYLPNMELVTAKRADPESLLPKALMYTARRIAFTRWYLGGSALLEWKAVRRLAGGFCGIVHVLWADHDLGFLDLVVQSKKHPLVGTFHNCDDTLPYSIRQPKRLKHFDAVVLMSESQRPFFEKCGLSKERIHVVHHGVDTEYYAPPLSRVDDKLIALSVGGYRRNFPLLREVCLAMGKSVWFECWIFAPLNYRKFFADLPNVRFYSNVPDAELLDAYHRASCLLLTVENATANNALLEAMACGLPVISESVGGIPEYVNSDCAVLVPPDSVAEIIDTLRQLKECHELRETMGWAARRRALELDWHRVAERMVKLYAGIA